METIVVLTVLTASHLHLGLRMNLTVIPVRIFYFSNTEIYIWTQTSDNLKSKITEIVTVINNIKCQLNKSMIIILFLIFHVVLIVVENSTAAINIIMRRTVILTYAP